MKSESIFIFIFYWLNHHSIANSKACEDSTYEKGDDGMITKAFQSEWGVLGYINRAIYRSNEEFTHLTKEESKMLCACAFIKTKPSYASNREDLLNGVTTWSINKFHVPIDYMCFSTYDHPVPSLECTYGTDKIALGKSFKKKSFWNLVWDIYVARMEGSEVKNFEGIIKNVDLSFKSEKYIEKKKKEEEEKRKKAE